MGDWPQFRFDAQRTGYNANEPTLTPAQVKANGMVARWIHVIGVPIGRSSPCVVNGVLYIGASDGYLYALTATTGVQRWRTNIGFGVAIDSSPMVCDSLVYVGSPNGNLYALNVSDGSIAHTMAGSGGVSASPLFTDTQIIWGDDAGVLHAMDRSRNVLWTNTFNGPMASACVGPSGNVYGAGGDFVRKLSGVDGSVAWEYEMFSGANVTTPRSPVSYVVDADGNPLIVTGSPTTPNDNPDGGLYVLNADTGVPVWIFGGAGHPNGVAYTPDGSINLLTHAGSIHCFDLLGFGYPPVAFTADAATDTFTAPGHPFGTLIAGYNAMPLPNLATGPFPGGLQIGGGGRGTNFYNPTNVTATTFQLTDSTGALVDVRSDGVGIVTWGKANIGRATGWGMNTLRIATGTLETGHLHTSPAITGNVGNLLEWAGVGGDGYPGANPPLPDPTPHIWALSPPTRPDGKNKQYYRRWHDLGTNDPDTYDIESSPTVVDGALYFGSENGNVYSYILGTGGPPAMPTRALIPQTVIVDRSGAAVSGANVHFYKKHTTTPISDIIYTLDTGGVTRTNPVQTDAGGQIPECWVDIPGTDVPDFITVAWDDASGTAVPPGVSGSKIVAVGAFSGVPVIVFASPMNSAPGDANSQGTSGNVADADHVHGREAWGVASNLRRMGVQTTSASLSTGFGGDAGSSSQVADVGHSHPASRGTFGSGGDGALVFDGVATILGIAPVANVYTLTKDVFATDLTVSTGVTILPVGFRIHASGTLTNQGLISANGANASGGTAGAAQADTGPLGGGGNGGNGSVNNGANGTGVTVAGGGNGGAAGAGGTGTAGTGGGTTNIAQGKGGNNAFGSLVAARTGQAFGASGVSTINGGGGGGGGGGDTTNTGGGGGGGGGCVLINASKIDNTTGTISAKGGNGVTPSAGNAGGGGGGGGGIVWYTTRLYVGTAPVVTGGTKGSLHGTGANGTNGTDGNVVGLVV